MSNTYLFKVRDGSTNLSKDELAGLKLKHITTMRQLDEAEGLNILEGLKHLAAYQGKDFFTITFAVKLHLKLFEYVWNWAGKFRTTEKNIGIAPEKVQTELYKLFENTKFQIENNSYPANEIGARFHHRLVQIHPFANGNGRWARIYTEFIYKKMNWGAPNWHPELSPEQRRGQYIAALRQADEKKYEALIDFMKPHYPLR